MQQCIGATRQRGLIGLRCPVAGGGVHKGGRRPLSTTPSTGLRRRCVCGRWRRHFAWRTALRGSNLGVDDDARCSARTVGVDSDRQQI
jgi:hypothetical protein